MDQPNFENLTSLGDSSDPGNLTNLFPALVQIFLTVLLGYIAGLANVINPEQAQGLNIFVGKFSLPVMLFISLFRLDFSAIDWAFLLAVLVTKSAIFFGVIFTDYVLDKPRDIGRASIFGIFCTQSNDFGMGLPILNAVYGTGHIFVTYLFIVAPISLLILNPIGFLLMEISKSQKQTSWKETISKVVVGILTNPVVFMTFIGIVCNFIFKNQVPDVFENFLEALASAFTSTAPFCLGLSLVGNSGAFKAKGLIPIFWIVLIKSLVSAILNRTCVHLFSTILPVANGTSTTELENFAFLYGTFPTANGVFAYASQYGIIPDTIAGAIVIGTVVSAPIMYIAASILTIMEVDKEEMATQLQQSNFEVAVVSVICVFIVFAVFILRRNLHSVLHKLTAVLMLLNLLACISVFILYTLNTESMTVAVHYMQACLFIFGVAGARLTSASLAIAMWLSSTKRLEILEKIQTFLLLSGPVLSALAVTALALVAPDLSDTDTNGEFQFGDYEAKFVMTVLGISTIITVAVLVTIKNSDGGLEEKEEVSKRSSNGTIAVMDFYKDSSSKDSDLNDKSVNGMESGPEENFTSVQKKRQNTGIQLTRHKFLLLFLVVSIITGFIIAIWTSFGLAGDDSFTGVYKVLVFMDSFLNVGQGILVFLVFGFDSALISSMKSLFGKLKLNMKKGKFDSQWMN